MVNIKNDGKGNIVLFGEQFDLKIDANRVIYVKKKEDSEFKSTENKIDLGYSSKEKEKYIYNLYRGVLQRKSELNDEKEAQTKRFI